MQLRYPVYADLTATAARLTLADGGAGLDAMQVAFGTLAYVSNCLSWCVWVYKNGRMRGMA